MTRRSPLLTRRHLCWLTLLLAVILAAPARAQVKHVVIISFDGLRPDAIDAAKAPVLQRLRREGAVADNARTISPSVTLPSHASMLSGLKPARHKVNWNSYQPDRGHIKAPTCQDIAHKAGLGTALIVGKKKLVQLARPGMVDFVKQPGYWSMDVAPIAAAYLAKRQPALMFVHFSDPDGAGHKYGWMTPQQLDAIAKADASLGQIIKRIETTDGLRGQTLVIITADHGGHGKSHGSKRIEDMKIPWIAWGAGVKPGRHQEPVVTYDTAATALYALGLPVPKHWDGKPQTWAFQKKIARIPVAPPKVETAPARLRIVIRDATAKKPLAGVAYVRPVGQDAIWGRDALGDPLKYGGPARLWGVGEIVCEPPPGECEVIVAHPYDYGVYRERVTLEAGKETVIHADLTRLYATTSEGWYGGDAHDHVVHGERQYAVNIPFVAAITQAEGLDWVSYCGGYSSVPGQQISSAELQRQCEVVSGADFQAWWGDEHPKDHLGHMAALPLPKADHPRLSALSGSNGYRQLSKGSSYRFTHAEIVGALYRAGGGAVYTHPTRESGGTEASVGNIARELPFDLLAAPELIHTLDIMTDRPDNPNSQALLHMYLNHGYRIGVAAFNDTAYDRHDARPGFKRTYVYLGGQPLTASNVTQAFRAGRTFGTTGPFVDFSISGERPGHSFPAGVAERALKIVAHAPGVNYHAPEQPVYLSEIQLLRQGRVVNRWRFPANRRVTTFEISQEITPRETCWYAVKVLTHTTGRGVQVAQTSPIYFRAADFEAPAPVQARARLEIFDAKTNQPLAAVVEVVDYGYQRAEVLKRYNAPAGRLTLSAPARYRLRVSAPGYEPRLLSFLLDWSPLIDDLLMPLRREQLLDWGFHERIRAVLQKVEWRVELQRRARTLSK